MKPYGVRRRDRGCCPGHDKFPNDTYGSRRSHRARSQARQLAHSIARARSRQELRRTVANLEAY